MNDLREALQEWAAEMRQTLPWRCPGCEGDLEVVRYVHQRDRIRIHLTGVTIDDDYCVAECPSCGRELARKFLGTRRSFWK